MAMLDPRFHDLSPGAVASTSPSPPPSDGTESPQHGQSSLQKTREHMNRRQQRHSKRLSLNFPILIPVRGTDTPDSQHTASPTALSTQFTTNPMFISPPSSHASNSAVPSSLVLPMPPTPPSEEDPLQPAGITRSKSKGHGRQESTSTEFLTMLASQERRVLELKEELGRAETELTTLKKQWAQYEAGKKKNEVKGVPVRIGPGAATHARDTSVVEVNTGLGLMGVESAIGEDTMEAERERRREMVRERMMGRLTNLDPGHPANGGTKKNGQRVFSSSRHTRTLSLLTPTTGNVNERIGAPDSTTQGKTSLDAARQTPIDTTPTTASPSMPGLTRTNSGIEGLNLGKTYKDLASASRKNLPPGLNPEQFVKTGKQMVDGVRDGLWNFFEDIRQATVGEEAITGAGAGVRRQNSMKHPGSAGNLKLRRSMTDGIESSKNEMAKENETSFWKEFGVETPKTDKARKEHADKSNRRSSKHKRRPSTKNAEDPEGQHGSQHEQMTKTVENPASQAPAPDSSKVLKTPSPAGLKKEFTEQQQHHESKSSTDSGHPPSLMADLLDDDDDSWDTWDSHTDPGNSPRSERKRAALGEKRASGDRQKEVQWHGLIS